MPLCVAIGCYNKSYRKTKAQLNFEHNAEITFHQFPKDETRKAVWIKAMHLHVGSLPKCPHLCSLYFFKNDFDRSSLVRTRLRENAIPNANINISEGGPKEIDILFLPNTDALTISLTESANNNLNTLLDAGANVNVITKSEGRTPLHLACLNDRVDAAKLLLNCATCDVDVKDHNGDTPLHLATVVGNVKSVGMLIRYGACTNVRNLQNKTPLRQAEEALSFSANYAGILKILKQNSTQSADN